VQAGVQTTPESTGTATGPADGITPVGAGHGTNAKFGEQQLQVTFALQFAIGSLAHKKFAGQAAADPLMVLSIQCVVAFPEQLSGHPLQHN